MSRMLSLPLATVNARMLRRITLSDLIAIILGIVSISSIAVLNPMSMAISAISLMSYFAARCSSARALRVVLLWLLSITCLVAIVQLVLSLPGVSWLGNPNLVGYMAVILLILGLVSRSYWAISIAAVALISSRCEGAILSVCVGYVIWSWRKGDHIPALLAASVAIVLLMTHETRSYLLRLVTWYQAIGALVDHGALFGATDVSTTFTEATRIIHTHNAVLESIAGTGFVPGLAMVGLGGVATHKLITSKRIEYCLAGGFLLVSSLVDYIYWYPFVSTLVIAFLISIEGEHA